MKFGNLSYTVNTLIPAIEELYVQIDLEPPEASKSQKLRVQAWASIQYHDSNGGNFSDDSGRNKFYNSEALVPMVRLENSLELVPAFLQSKREYFNSFYKITAIVSANA